jgi:hypothetical protein
MNCLRQLPKLLLPSDFLPKIFEVHVLKHKGILQALLGEILKTLSPILPMPQPFKK